LRADIDYAFVEGLTTFSKVGVKVWVYKGEVFPEAKEEPVGAYVSP
jgi:small subunit ribosomal protein S3